MQLPERWAVTVFRALPLIACISLSMAGSMAAHALPLSSLADQGLDGVFGEYAPSGDCSKEPRVVINKDGMTFRAKGRHVRPKHIEHALTFMGPRYDGITAVFFPFPVSNSDFGRLIMFVNDDERPGVIRFEADIPPGERPDPFHAAFVDAGLLRLCKNTASAAPALKTQPQRQNSVSGIPVEWKNLSSLVGKYPGDYAKDNIDLFEKGVVAKILKARLGPKVEKLKANLAVVSPLRRAGSLFYLTGNAEHQGGAEQAYIMIDPSQKDVQVGLWERGRLTVYPPASGVRLSAVADIQAMLDRSPPETAVPLPGTAWEVVPVQGRSAIAYVNAAASPNIEAISLYCENAKPYVAMLLNKAAPGNLASLTWNFSGRLVNIPVKRANPGGTQWIGGLSGSDLFQLLAKHRGTALLRIDGRQEGEVSLENVGPVLRDTVQGCYRR